MRMSKLVSEWPANILDWLNFFSFQESILSHSLKMVGGSEVQNSATWQIAHNQQEVGLYYKVSHGYQMFRYPLSWNARADLKKSNALARASFYFVSFIYDHPVHT